MPIGTSPGELGPWVWLDADANVPHDTRTRFRPRFPSARQAARIERLMDEAVAVADRDQALDKLLAALGLIVGECENLPACGGVIRLDMFKFHAAHERPSDEQLAGQVSVLADALTQQELWQLYIKLVQAVRVTEEDLKNSGSPSRSAAATSAANADATAAAGGAASTSPT
jgi:hypothetical protein